MAAKSRLLIRLNMFSILLFLFTPVDLQASGSFLNGLLSPLRTFAPFQDPPVNLEPSNGARLGPDDFIPVFRFTEIADAVSYEIEFSLSPEFHGLYVMGISEPEWDLSEHLSIEEWIDMSFLLYWRGRAVFSGAEFSEWTEGWSISKSRFFPPQLLSPGDDARFDLDDLMPVLSWIAETEVVSFGVEFASDSEFSNSYGWYEFPGTAIDFNESGDRSAWDNLADTFYWRVWGIEDNGVFSRASEIWYFSKTKIGKPLPVEPENNYFFSAIGEIPVLRWDALPDVTTYHVQVTYGETEFPAGVDYIEASQNLLDFAGLGVTSDLWNSFYGKLNWRVAGVDLDSNHGSFSLPFHFAKIAEFRYMAYGDSITGGFGSSSWGSGFAGYPRILEGYLKARYGEQVEVICEENHSWFPGGHAFTGDWMIQKAMEFHGPSVVMIMFGSVDVIDTGAPGCDNSDCHVQEHLQSIIQTVRACHATPFLAVLPPVNPDSERAEAQVGIDELNNDIRELAIQMGVPIAELDVAFMEAPNDLPTYYYNGDWAHFNDGGYEIIASTWLDLL